jgi:hypothetical protein
MWLCSTSIPAEIEQMQAAIGVFLIDFVVRPFAKIFEKMPILMLVLLLVLYGYIAYLVLRSAYVNEGAPR